MLGSMMHLHKGGWKMDPLLCLFSEQIWLLSSCSVQRVSLILMGVYFYRHRHGEDFYTFCCESCIHRHTPIQHTHHPWLLQAWVCCLLQLLREFLQTSLLRFLIAPDDTLLIFSLLLFSQESNCSSFPVWWFIVTVKVLVRARFGELYKTSVV